MRCAPYFFAGLTLAAVAQAAQPQIDRLEPQGVRRGAEVTVTVRGSRVGEDPLDLMRYEPGIEIETLESTDKNACSVRLKIADDCPLGRHAVRLRTATGVSNLVTLHVGALESVDEVEPNNTLEAAQEIPLQRTVHGLVSPEDEDVYRLALEAGQRVSLEVEGMRLGRTFLDPVIEVLDSAGRLLTKNDDQTASYSDPFLTFTAAEAGLYHVRVRESAFRGDGRATYLLHVGDFPRPRAVYPPAVQRGGAATVRWIGEDFDQTVAPPENAPRLFDVFAQNERGAAPSGLKLLACDNEPALEAEPNDKREEATPLPCPGVAAGVLATPGDRDFFRFQAKAKQALDLRVVAREIRSPLDAVLRVHDAAGKQLAANDDDRGKPDSYLRFTPNADGEYLLRIEDRLNRGSDAHVYAIEVKHPAPAADITLDERRRYETTHLEVPQGGRCAGLFTVNRRDVGGELQLELGDLPPGVTATAFPLAGNYNRVPVVLEAAPDASLAGGLANVTVKHANPIESRFRQQTWLVRGRNNVSVWSHYTDRTPVAVVERLPFEITLAQPKAPLCRNGSTDLRVTARRDEGDNQAISVRMLYHPPGVSSNRSRSIGKDATDVTIPVTANGNARVGEWPIVVVGEVNRNGRLFVSTQFVQLQVAEDYFDLSVPALDTVQGASADLTVALSHRTPFDGPATLELVGLPPGVTAEAVEVTAGAESAVFALNVAADAKPGRHRGVGVRVRLDVEGEPVTYRQAYSELRIDPASRTAVKETTKK